MWNWYSSNPRPISERTCARLASLVATALVATAPAIAQPLRQVLVEFRIESGSTLDQARLRSPEAIAAVESRLARLARQQFLFLEWLPAGENPEPDAPRWVLLLADGPSGACDPPSVRARFSAERGGLEAWSYPEMELTALCDLAAPELTLEQLVTRISTLADLVFRDADAMRTLESQFLSEIVVSKSLAPDAAAQKLYLPLKGLKAKAESEIEVRFENRRDNRLFAHPGDIDGDRTQLLLESFVCAGIASGTPAANALPLPWHPRLPEVLDTCHDPWVYMKVYKPNPLEVEAGIVTTLDDGGMP